MSGFLLDTNVPSELIRPQPEPKVKTWVAAQSLDTLFISAVSFGEFRKGITLRSPGKRRAELEAWIETDRQVCFPAAFCQSHDFVLYVDMMPVGVGARRTHFHTTAARTRTDGSINIRHQCRLPANCIRCIRMAV
jgi:hypothetical protein